MSEQSLTSRNLESSVSSPEFFFPGEKISETISDGFGPMQRWERDRVDESTVSVIVQRVAEGERLKVICKSRGWPYSLVAQWVAENENVSKAYEQALRIAADDLAQESVAIADDADPENVAHAKHRTDVRLKLAGKLHRDRYGEQVQHNVSIDPFGEMLKRVSERNLARLREAQTPRIERDVTPVAVVTVVAEDPI